MASTREHVDSHLSWRWEFNFLVWDWHEDALSNFSRRVTVPGSLDFDVIIVNTICSIIVRRTMIHYSTLLWQQYICRAELKYLANSLSKNCITWDVLVYQFLEDVYIFARKPIYQFYVFLAFQVILNPMRSPRMF